MEISLQSGARSLLSDFLSLENYHLISVEAVWRSEEGRAPPGPTAWFGFPASVSLPVMGIVTVLTS